MQIRLHTVFLCILALLLASAPESAAQPAPRPESTTIDTPADEHTPRGALWRAAVLPGWGQFYNHQYLKIPVLYGALGGLTALALTFNQQYLLFRHAYLYRAYKSLVESGEISSHPYPYYRSDYERLINRTGPLPAELLRRQRDKLRRNRDLMYISIAIVYGLSIVDAYVSAHLADFNVTEDLSLQVYPGRQWSIGITANW